MPTPTGEQEDKPGTPPAGIAKGAEGDAGKTDAGKSGAQGDLTQAAVDAIVARERRRADAELASLRTDFETKIAALTKTPGSEADKSKATDDGIAAARKPLEDALNTEKTNRAKLEKTLVSTMIEAAAKDTTAPKVAAMLADGQVRLKDDGTVEVVDASGQPRYTAKGPMTLPELVAEIAAANAFLVPASMRKGGDYKGSDPQAKQTIAEQIHELEAAGKFTEASRLKSKQLAGMKA